MENSSELQIFEFANKGIFKIISLKLSKKKIRLKLDSLAYQIYNKRNKNDICFFFGNEKIPNISRRNLENIFVIIIDFAKHLILKSVQILTDKDTYLSKLSKLFFNYFVINFYLNR